MFYNYTYKNSINEDNFEKKQAEKKEGKINIGKKTYQAVTKQKKAPKAKKKSSPSSQNRSPPFPKNRHAKKNIFRASNDAIRDH